MDHYNETEKAYEYFDKALFHFCNASTIVFGLLGILGSILTLITVCRNKDFSEPCFLCYQAVAIYEIPISFHFSIQAMNFFLWNYAGPIPDAWSWFTKFSEQILQDPLREAVTFITVFMAVTRVTACFFPTRFHLVDKRSVMWIMIFVSIPPLVALDIPNLVDFVMRYFYKGNILGSALDKALDYCWKIKIGIWTALGVAVLVSTALAVAAMLKTVFLRRTLFSQHPPNPANRGSDSPLAAVKRNLQLCVLQLALTIPLIFYNLLIFIIFWMETDADEQKKRGYFYLIYQRMWLWFWFFMCEAIAHCFHFYLYIAFSVTFRRGFFKRIGYKSDSVSSTQPPVVKTVNVINIGGQAVN